MCRSSRAPYLAPLDLAQEPDVQALAARLHRSMTLLTKLLDAPLDGVLGPVPGEGGRNGR